MSSQLEPPPNVGRDCVQYSDRTVIFHDQFTLGASAQIFPAGRYVIEDGDCSYEGQGHTGHVRSSTVLVITTPTGTRNVSVNGSDLDSALAADLERHNQLPNENPDRGQTRSTEF